MLTSVPDYRVTARNTSVHSANKIHDDAVARLRHTAIYRLLES